MTELFFELIRVAIGMQERLSRVPSKKEWGRLFKMAERQRLLGICFYGVKKVASPKYDNEASPQYNNEAYPQYNNDDDNDYDPSATTIPGDLYDYWLGTAALIQQQNQKVNSQCVEVCNKLQEAGFKCSILKGQGIAQLYNEGRKTKDESNFLGMFRQSGDIDVWVDGGMKKAMAWAKKEYGDVRFDYINAHLPMYKDTEVELHWRVQSLDNLWKNKKLQRWLEEHKEELLNTTEVLPDGAGSIPVPSPTFNSFYILLHCYHHMFTEGLGLRQVMDYYFVLQSRRPTPTPSLHSEGNLETTLREFGMLKFAKAMMWVLMHVFECHNESLTPTPSPEGKGIYDNDKPTLNPHPSLHSPSRSLPLKGRENLNWRERYPWMIVEPDEKEGRFLLKELMLNGNFGHFDKRVKKVSKNKKIQSVWTNIQHTFHLASHYPSECFWNPIWIAWHFVWKRTVNQ